MFYTCRFWDIQYNIEKCRDLEIGVKGHSRSLKVVSFDSVYGFLLVFFSNFVPKTHRFWVIRLQKCRDLENRVRSPSRSLEMSPFDGTHMTSYWRSIVTMALSSVVSQIFMSKNVVTLKSESKVTQGHWKWYHSIDCVVYGCLLVFFSNFVLKTHRFWVIRLQKCRDLENRVRGPSRSVEMSPFDGMLLTSYWRSIVTMAPSSVVSQIFMSKNVVTLKSGSEVTQGHWKWHHSVDRVRFAISVL